MKKKKPWYDVVLDIMGEKISEIRRSVIAETELIELGSIFEKAIIPKENKSEIVMAIEKLSYKLSSYGETGKAHDYLLDLSRKLT